MKRKNPFRLWMDFDGPWLNLSAALMGVAFFLRAVYYCGVRGLGDDLGTLLLMMAIPMILEAAFAVVIRLVQPNVPLVFGILSSLCCILLLIQCFFSGDFLQILFGVIAYPVCIIAMMAFLFGLLRSRGLIFVVYAATFAVRFILFDFSDFQLPEVAALCAVLGMTMIPLGMKVIKKAPHRKVKSA